MMTLDLLVQRLEVLDKQMAQLLDKKKSKKKKPPTGYILFSNATRDKMKQEIEDNTREKTKSTQVMKNIASLWNALDDDERKGWNNKAKDVKFVMIQADVSHADAVSELNINNYDVDHIYLYWNSNTSYQELNITDVVVNDTPGSIVANVTQITDGLINSSTFNTNWNDASLSDGDYKMYNSDFNILSSNSVLSDGSAVRIDGVDTNVFGVKIGFGSL